MTFLYWTTNGSLQTVSDNKMSASENLGSSFSLSIVRACNLGYLNTMYANPYPNPLISKKDTIEATAEGFFHETENAGDMLIALVDLHGVSSESPIHHAYDLLTLHINGYENFSDGSMAVHQMMGLLFEQASVAGNYTKPLMAFENLHSSCLSAFTALGQDVLSWSYQPSNSTLLSNIGTDVNLLEATSIQWSNSYR